MIRKHLSYANVTATLALVLAAGTGVVYAAGEIGSRELANNSVRTQDLKDRRGVVGEDVRRNALGGTEIDERSLAGAKLVGLEGEQAGTCDPQDTTFTDCVAETVQLAGPSRLLVITSAGFYAEGDDATAECELRIDGVDASIGSTPGQEADNSSLAATDGFARTMVSDVLPAGPHNVALACQQIGSEDARIAESTLAILAVRTR
jgi:hypothetical protein